MRILLVSHQFPPHASAGTETYTAELGLELARRGHDVTVFASVKDIAAEDLTLRARTWRGLAVREVVNNLYHREFRSTWEHPGIERLFERMLGELAPDLVHFQHLMYLSAGCVEIARRSGAAVVFTLHDFWLECPRFGQRVHADGGVCDTIDFARCGTCLARFDHRQGDVERRLGGVIARVRKGTGVDLGPIARTARKALARRGDKSSAHSTEVDGELAAAMRAEAEERSASLQRRLIPAVDRFLAPSRFLRDRFVREWGMPEEKIEHLRFGIDLAAFGSLPRIEAEMLRVRFIGTLVPIKGAHLLLEAWTRLSESQRSRARLTIHGPSRHEPRYQVQLASLAAAAGAELAGALEREDVPRVLAHTDLLVVPSVWFENAPLVILEALASRTPLLVSDQGGMAELVEPGVSGFRFKMGDVDDLARELARSIDDRARLARLYERPVAIPTFVEHVERVLERYASVLGERAAGRGPGCGPGRARDRS